MNTTENTNNTSRRMPAIFVGHGSPMNAINNGLASQEWQKRSKTLPQPKAIIAISGHWATRGLWIRRSTTNPHINDMYGFPKALYEIPYAPAGSIEITDHVIDTIGADFIKPTTESRFQNLVDALDEMAICRVRYYMILDISRQENDFIKNPTAGLYFPIEQQRQASAR